MNAYYRILLDKVLKIPLTIVTCITTLLLLSSSLYANNGNDFLSKDEQGWLAKNQSKITRAVETGYAPFVFIDSKDRPVGLAHDYMLLLESKLGVHFKEKHFSTLNEIFDKLKSGEVNIVNAVTNTPARSEFITFTDPFISVPNVIIVQNNRTRPIKEENLNGLKVSLVKGYAITEYLINKGLSFTPDLVPDDITALYNVSSGHTDAAIIDLATASFLISTKGITNLRIAGETTFAIQLAMGTGIAEPMLNSILQKGLAQITEAERKEIRNRWINISRENIFADWRFWAVVIGALFVLCASIFGNILWNRTLRRQVLLRTKELSRETEALQELKEELQAQNEELAVTEEELRFQNDELLATQELLQRQMEEYEISQKLLKSSDAKFTTLLNNTRIQLWAFDGTSYTYTNREWFDFTGQSSDSPLTIERWKSALHPDDLESSGKIWMSNWEAKTEHDNYFRLRRHDGVYRDFFCHVVPITNEHGEFQYFQGFNLDITERKQVEISLRETNSYLDNLFTYANAPIIVWNTSFRITRFNKAFEKLTGRTSDEVINRDISILFPADQIDSSMALIRATLSGDRWETVEIPIFNVNGTVSVILWNSANIYAADGTTPVATIAQGQDITERKQMEKNLSQQKALFEAIFTCIPDAIVYTNVDRYVVGINPAFTSILGFTIDDLKEKKTSFFYESPEEYERQGKIRFNMTASEHVLPYEVNYRKKDGSTFPGETLGTVITDVCGTVLGYIGVIRDITDRKRAEEEKYLLEQQFQHTQKLESLGVLAGGIAHDFNNILAIIVGYCGLTKMDYEYAEKNIPEIEKAAERAAALCRQMLAYAGKASLTQSQINTWMLVDEMVTMLKTTIQQNVVIKHELRTDFPFILGDASQLRQVVMNLIINAAEAIGDSEGEIDVKLTKTEIKAEQPEKDHLGVIIPAGHYICFEVTDNGCGMDDVTRLKIFEPFYTTKFTGRGLGMSAVLGIIKAHNGALQLESRLGLGTTFRVYMPVQPGKTETEEVQQITVSAPWQGSGTILLAEDEVQVKSIAIALLKKLGFNVLDAVNGKEALELYQQNAANITLVVTDMGMPVMNGYELFYKLKQLSPHVPIIISSGFGEGDIGSKIPRDEIAGMINKPYKFEQLRDVLKGVVEGTK